MPEERAEGVISTPAEQKRREASFGERLRELLEPGEGKEPVIKSEPLCRLAKLASQSRNQTPEKLEELLRKGDDWCAEGQVPEEEWAVLAGLMWEELNRLLSDSSKRVSLKAIWALVNAIEDQIKASQQQAKELAENLRRLPSDVEKARWVDAEYRQEFYTRFTPNLEPRFYTELEKEEERRLWEARWQLARAAYWKRVYSAFPEKQVENQDLQLLSTEQMEMLYKMRGVRAALEWYADIIVSGRKIRLPNGKEMSIWECKKEADWEQFRRAMRIYALGIRVEALDEPESLWAKEADAVAWNWMWVSGLIESVDSRYSKSGGRHGGLPGVMVSDDLRSVFHPQEKYEDKCRSGLEWGAFGKWGVTQMERIKRELAFNKDQDVIEFRAAPSSGYFWKASRPREKTPEGKSKIVVFVPECYPTISMGSFWEETKIGDRIILLDYLLKREEIPWEQVGADPWIGYLGIKLNKAVALLNFFLKGPDKPGWSSTLMDIFRRLGLKEKYGNDRFHNLKVWAVWAAYGGVGRPQDRFFTTPLSESRIGSPLDKRALKNLLRKPQLGYLEKGENLDFRFG